MTIKLTLLTSLNHLTIITIGIHYYSSRENWFRVTSNKLYCTDIFEQYKIEQLNSVFTINKLNNKFEIIYEAPLNKLHFLCNGNDVYTTRFLEESLITAKLGIVFFQGPRNTDLKMLIERTYLESIPSLFEAAAGIVTRDTKHFSPSDYNYMPRLSDK
jgi:hypothetical protein